MGTHIYGKKTVSVIIPTLNAEKELPIILNNLHNQNYPIEEVIIIDSSSTDHTVDICKNDDLVHLIQIRQKDFDHGRTRDMALRSSVGDIVVFLTQDAIPANDRFIQNLINPLLNNEAIISTGKQIPKQEATKIEQLIRAFNYPEGSCIKSKKDIADMGIKTFFCSNVCAAYERNAYLKLGGFEYPLKTNEDMFFAAYAIRNGYKVAYAADAVVYHSHNLTLRQQFKRNYMQGYEIERHKNLIGNVKIKSEGIQLVKYVSKMLIMGGNIILALYFLLDFSARFIGNESGKIAYVISAYMENMSIKFPVMHK